MISARASGKIILFGEHAVVYGRPALAVPVQQVNATVRISPIQGQVEGQILIQAPQINLFNWLHDIDPEHPLAKAIHLTLRTADANEFEPIRMEISSSIPIASGLGSSAAVSVAVVRALSQYLGSPFPAEVQSQIAFEVEKLYHGTPSGIDNTVIAHERPVFFIAGEEPKPFSIGAPFFLVIADTGVSSPTSEAVAKVRAGWEKEKDYFEALFDQIGEISRLAKRTIKEGQIHVLGPLMNHNQVLLEALGVSSPELERLIHASREAGALGAKLSGAGLGGNMIALVEPHSSQEVNHALHAAGAAQTILTRVQE
jgi:mevalonate kinase